MQREGRIVLSTDNHWAKPLAKIQDIKELYVEFVHIDVAVLQVIMLPMTDCLFECGLHDSASPSDLLVGLL